MNQVRQRFRWSTPGLVPLFFLLSLTLVGCGSQPASASQSARAIVDQPTRVSPNQSEVRIMPLGDSITYGQGSSNGGGYRFPLWNELKGQGVHITFVGSMLSGPTSFSRANEGLPGWKIGQISARVVGWLTQYQPQIILLHIGTNDLLKQDNPSQAPARLKHLIEQITTTLPGATLLVAQIIPIGRSSQLDAEVRAYNAAMPALVSAEAAQGRRVQLVDMYHAVSSALLVDGVHPGDRAYALMAQVWDNALIPLLEPGRNAQS